LYYIYLTNTYQRRSYSFIGSYPDGTPSECLSTITAGQQISVILYKAITNSNEVASAWVTSISTALSATAIIGIYVNDWNFVPTTTTTFSSLSSTPPSQIIPGTTNPSPSSPPSIIDNTGRNIGIGVGVSCGTIGILALCFAIWYVRRKRLAPPSYARPQTLAQTWDGAPNQTALMYEMGSAERPAVQEMQASYARINELSGNEPVH